MVKILHKKLVSTVACKLYLVYVKKDYFKEIFQQQQQKGAP
jgi:hypothetical protein